VPADVSVLRRGRHGGNPREGEARSDVGRGGGPQAGHMGDHHRGGAGAMTASDLQIGQRAWWTRDCSNYGHVEHIPVTIRRIGKRITVEAPLRHGGTKMVAVTRGRLSVYEEDQT